MTNSCQIKTVLTGFLYLLIENVKCSPKLVKRFLHFLGLTGGRKKKN